LRQDTGTCIAACQVPRLQLRSGLG
jgi:hypothetical protein